MLLASDLREHDVNMYSLTSGCTAGTYEKDGRLFTPYQEHGLAVRRMAEPDIGITGYGI